MTVMLFPFKIATTDSSHAMAGVIVKGNHSLGEWQQLASCLGFSGCWPALGVDVFVCATPPDNRVTLSGKQRLVTFMEQGYQVVV